MKKYEITSTHFLGKAEVWYFNNRLCYLNTVEVLAPERIHEVLLHMIPYHIKSGHLMKSDTVSIFKITEVAA